MSKLAICMTLMPLLLGGCIFSPKRSKGPVVDGPPSYKDLSRPEWVLDNLVLSYAARDSNEYKLLFDESLYFGESTDYTQPTVVTDTLRYGDEARHIGKLARATDVTRIEMNFGAFYHTESPYIDDPPGSALITVSNPSLTIYQLGDNALQVAGVQQYEFRFGPTVHAPGDTTWKIIHWTEVRN